MRLDEVLRAVLQRDHQNREKDLRKCQAGKREVSQEDNLGLAAA